VSFLPATLGGGKTTRQALLNEDDQQKMTPLEEISEHGIFHGITVYQENK